MSAAAYLASYVFTTKEFEFLAKKWGIDQTVTPDLVRAIENKNHGLRVYVRQHTRLFIKLYVYSKLIVLAASSRVPILRQVAEVAKISGSITLMSAGYRALYFAIRKFVNKYGNHETYKDSVARVFVSAIAAAFGTCAFRMMPSYTRDYIAIYVAVKALEYLYNRLEDAGLLTWKPRILGSWLLLPLSMSQLVPMLFMNPRQVPTSFKRIMLLMRGSYGPQKPHGYPSEAEWPSTNAWLKSVGEIATLRFPKFQSAIIYRNIQPTPQSLKAVDPILQLAHPGIKLMTSAVLHPNESSELRPFVSSVLSGYTSSAMYLLPLYVLQSFGKRGRSVGFDDLVSAITSTVKTSTFISMITTSVWAGVGLSQSMLGSKVPPKSRFQFIGFASGLWALVDSFGHRARNLFVLRLAILGKLHEVRALRNGRPILANGDSIVFAVAMAVIFAVYNSKPSSISSARARKTLNFMQTGVYKDPAPLCAKEE